MTDKEKKNKIADILLDFYEEYHSGEINRPMIPSIYAGKILDSLQEEPVTEDLEEAAVEWFNSVKYKSDLSGTPINAFKAGAKWNKEHLWKPADSNDLPEIDKDVIVLTQPYPLDRTEYVVSFAHRPYKGKYIYKNLTTGNIETFENETYDEGGWNIPDIKWWLDVDLPKEIEL